jgi:hypothetical protein
MAERDPEGTLLTDDPNTVDTQDTGDPMDTQDQSDNGADDSTKSEQPDLIAGKYKTQDELVTAYKSLESLMGKSVQIPEADAPDEEWAKFYGKLGAADTPDGYELDAAEGVPEGFVNEFKQFAVDSHLPPALAKRAYEWFLKSGRTQFQNGDVPKPVSKSEALRSLAGEWGPNLKTKLIEAQQTVKNGGPELTNFITKYKVGNHPVMLKLLAEAGGRYSEETLLTGDLEDTSADTSLESIFK